MANEFKKGDTVRFVDSENMHDECPRYYPETGTTGTVLGKISEIFGPWAEGVTDIYVQWPEGSTALDDCWACRPDWLELVEEADEA